MITLREGVHFDIPIVFSMRGIRCGWVDSKQAVLEFCGMYGNDTVLETSTVRLNDLGYAEILLWFANHAGRLEASVITKQGSISIVPIIQHKC